MLIAARVLLVLMRSAFHFLRIIFLNFRLILFIEYFLVCCVAHHRTTIRAATAAGLTAGGAGFFRLLLRYWFNLFRFWLVLLRIWAVLFRFLVVLFRFLLVLVYRVAGFNPLHPFRIIRIANPCNKFSARGSKQLIGVRLADIGCLHNFVYFFSGNFCRLWLCGRVRCTSILL
ncbi:Uncharacterised protein [Escherichia albertii]|nr:Uncharacterised protein [Escherichia coli]